MMRAEVFRHVQDPLPSSSLVQPIEGQFHNRLIVSDFL